MFQKVVVSVDGSPASHAAVRWCAEQLPSTTTVVAICGISTASEFIISIPPMSSGVESQIEEVFRHDWCAPLYDAGLDVQARLVHEDDADALLEVATNEHPDALILGKEHRHTLAEMFSASPLHRVIHRMPCPLVLIPAD